MSAGADTPDLFDLLPVGAYRADAHGRFLRANLAMARLFGHPDEAALLASVNAPGNNWYATPQRRTEFRMLLEARGEVRDFVSELVRSDTRERIWISENARLVRDAAGRTLFYEGTVQDISDRRRAEEGLQITLDSMSQGIALIDADGRIVVFNRRYQELLDFPPELMAAHPTMDTLVRFQIERGDFGENFGFVDAVARGYVSVGNRVAPLNGPESYLRTTRDGRTLEVMTRPLPDGGAVRTFTDVSAYTQAQAALEQKEAQLAALVRNLPHRVWLKDAAGVYRLSNPAHQRHLGLPEHEIVGRTAHDLLGPELGEAQRLTDLQAMASSEPLVYEDLIPSRADGGLRNVEVAKVAMRDEAGRCTGMLGIARDITARKQAEAALIAAKEVAEAGERAKAEFLANMSHEIRTPMNAVIGMSDLLLASDLTHAQREYAQAIKTSGDALLALINDILDFSKIESGRLELEQAPLRVLDCIESALDIAGSAAAAKGLELLYWIDDGVPAVVLGDAMRLRQVVVNLVSNAVKFTPQGEVVVTVAQHGDGDGQPLLRVAVRDSGIGIPVARMDRLFQLFSQVDASTTRQFGGTGLGLAICRRLVTLMGGRIWVDSEEGRGSTFFVELPCRPAPDPQPAPAAPPHALAGRRMLLVQGNASARDILARQLRRWGLQVHQAGDGAQALRQLHEHGGCDVAMLDAQLSDVDATALAEALRRQLGAALPVLLVAPRGTASPARSETFQHVLHKPGKAQALQEALLGLFGRAAASPAAPPAAADAQPRQGEQLPLRLLLAEDNAINQRVAQLMLERMGYEVEIVDNGQRAVDAVAAARQRGQPFDVVLMDVQMPVLDGLAASRCLVQACPDPRGRPWIVALTANAMQGDREACLAAGMDDYLSKPIRATEVAAALRSAAAQLAARRAG